MRARLPLAALLVPLVVAAAVACGSGKSSGFSPGDGADGGTDDGSGPTLGDGGQTLQDGAPSYFAEARAYVQLIDPTLAFTDGVSSDGSGTNTNVRALYQRCPHLGCKPNFCPVNYWFECPCHGSRYDRLGTKVQEFGPAPRSLDRFASQVQSGSLIVDTSKITLGPLPVALGQPGLIPPKSPVGCI